MLWLVRFTPLTVKRTRAALALTLIAAAACDERGATNPQHAPTQRASAAVTQTPTISVSPGDLYFANQAVGTSSAPKVDTVRNTGTEPVTLYIFGASPYPITNNDCPATLAPNQFCTISIAFAPTTGGLWAGLVMISSNASTVPYVVGLYGTGFVATPAISVTPASIGFGSVALGNATSGRVVKITSTGNGPLVISSLTVGGTNPGDFPIWSDGCSGHTLNPGTSCTASVSFEPLGIGTRSATITIAHNASGGPVAVSLSGTGVKGRGGYIP